MNLSCVGVICSWAYLPRVCLTLWMGKLFLLTIFPLSKKLFKICKKIDWLTFHDSDSSRTPRLKTILKLNLSKSNLWWQQKLTTRTCRIQVELSQQISSLLNNQLKFLFRNQSMIFMLTDKTILEIIIKIK